MPSPFANTLRPLSNHRSSNLTLTFGGMSLLVYGAITILSRSYGDLQLWPFLSLSLFNALLCFTLWFIHHRAQQQINVIALLGFAVAFRIVGVFTFPILEDDFYRYLWDAHQVWQTGSPYTYSPSHYFDSEVYATLFNNKPQLSDRFEIILDSINYPNIATVYGPSNQWLFALGYLIAPGEIWPLQCIFALFDISLIMILLKLAKPNSVLLYAWCPLIIKEFSMTAHPDVVGAFLVMAALLLHQNKRFYYLGVVLALASGIKIFAILVLPFFLQLNGRAWFSFILTATLIALPFGVIQAWFPSGLSTMSHDWLFNAPMYLLLNQLLSIETIKLILLSVLGLLCTYQFLKYLQQRHSITLIKGLKGELLYAALFLCAPVFNPWYLAWLLPFSVLRPSLWAWTLSVTALLSYASGININSSQIEAYALPNWIILIEFLAVVIAMLLTAYLAWLKQKNKN